MSAATARPLPTAHAQQPAPSARRFVVLLLAAIAALAALLLVASFLPSASLATRLLGAAGESRGGAFAQEFVANLGERLRLSGVTLLLLLSGLVFTRRSLEELVAAFGRDVARPIAWPSVATLALAGGATLVGLAVRIPFLGQPMRYDEALTFNEFASRPLYYGLSFYPDPNNHLLNTLLMHVAYLGLGNQPWVLRLPALLGGVLLVPATYALARLLFSPGAAVLSAVLVAVSSYLVEYSTNARGYTLQALAFAVLLTLVIVAVRRDSPTALLLAAVVAALGTYALPTMLYGMVIAATWLVIEMRRKPTTRIRTAHLVAAGLMLGLAVMLAYLPVLIVSGPDKLASNRFVVPLDVSQLATELPRSLARTVELWNRDVPLPLAALLGIGFVVVTVIDLRNKRVPLELLAPCVCLVLILVQRVAPFERVWLFLLPLYVAVASAGLARFVDGRLLGVAFGVVLGFMTLASGSILSSTETGTFPDAEAVARTLAPRLAPDDAVMTTLPASLPELQYYFPRFGLPTNVLVRAPGEAENLWVVTSSEGSPDVPGWTSTTEIERFPTSALFRLRRS